MNAKGLLAAVSIVGLLVLSTGVIQGDITGTTHDFGGDGWNSTGEICRVCHTPHNAGAPASLWNHETSVETFTMYTNAVSSTLDGAVDTTPNDVSLMCLSCHDGITNVDAFDGGSGGGVTVGGAAALGIDLRNDHPISIVYDEVGDTGLKDPSAADSFLGGVAIDDVLNAGKVECSTRHDVHDDTNSSFLRKPNTGSALCRTCHNK